MKKIITSIIMVIVLWQCSVVSAVALNNNPMLKDIKIDGQSMEPKFEMFTTEYVLTVGEEVEKIQVEPIPDDEKAKIEIKGNTTLQKGRNQIEIQVTAEDGQAKQSYFLYITKGRQEQANANLKELKIESVELAPTFDKNTIQYAFEYPQNLEKLKIEAISEAQGAKVEIIGNENLKEVTQNIEIKVTAKDNQTIKTYYLIAKKAGKEVENPEGNEPLKDEITQENNNKKFYAIFIILAIIMVVIIGKFIIGRGKAKNEK
ncbi:MAG: cadherin-like beta sandwich domain-containing protein [Clostridia bacterium]|nr:cadherin-like beta sandwich domain-containing protein [Clostridia bacterium]